MGLWTNQNKAKIVPEPPWGVIFRHHRDLNIGGKSAIKGVLYTSSAVSIKTAPRVGVERERPSSTPTQLQKLMECEGKLDVKD